jgi:hypothetical protein
MALGEHAGTPGGKDVEWGKHHTKAREERIGVIRYLRASPD